MACPGLADLEHVRHWPPPMLLQMPGHMLGVLLACRMPHCVRLQSALPRMSLLRMQCGNKLRASMFSSHRS